MSTTVVAKHIPNRLATGAIKPKTAVPAPNNILPSTDPYVIASIVLDMCCNVVIIIIK